MPTEKTRTFCPCSRVLNRTGKGLSMDLNFRETVSHADDLKYVGVKIKDIEKHIQEHEWRNKHATTHHGYSIVVYVIVSVLCLFIACKVLRCMLTRGLCRGVAGALRITHQTRTNPEFTGSGNIGNINIKTSNESLRSAPETIPLRAHIPSDSSYKFTNLRWNNRNRPHSNRNNKNSSRLHSSKLSKESQTNWISYIEY